MTMPRTNFARTYAVGTKVLASNKVTQVFLSKRQKEVVSLRGLHGLENGVL
jgi:hypothetical protein